MLKAFNTLIKPANDTLTRMLNAQYSEDYIVIPVRVKFPSGTTQIIEDGMVTKCDHKGATEGNVDIADLYYNPDNGEVSTIDDVRWMLNCDVCGEPVVTEDE